MFPELKDQSEKVVIRGAKQDAENCYEYLSKLNKELLVNNYRYEVPILKQFLQFQGKDILKKVSIQIEKNRFITISTFYSAFRFVRKLGLD